MSEGRDHFDAISAGDGVLVRMSDDVADTLRRLTAELIAFLDRDEVPAGRRRWVRGPRPGDVRRRMFPDVHSSRSEADAFRTRFHDVLTDTTPAHRVAARLDQPMPFLVPFDELDDWHTTMGLVRALQLSQRAHDQTIVLWTLGVQEFLILALDPQANNGWPA